MQIRYYLLKPSGDFYSIAWIDNKIEKKIYAMIYATYSLCSRAATRYTL